MGQNRTLVAIAGGDGAGKTTVARLLVERLNELGHSAHCVDRWDIVGSSSYPTADFLRNDVPHIRERITGMPPHSRFLFLLWTMALALSEDPVEDTDVPLVVIDGYWMKHAASEVAYGLGHEWVVAVANGLPLPHLVLHLRLAPDEAWRRKQGDVLPYECGMDESCSRESFLDHQGRIDDLLGEWSAAYGWREIDASSPVSDVVETAVSQTLAAAARHTTVSSDR